MAHFVPLSAVPRGHSVIASIDMTDDAGGPFHVLPGEVVTIGKTPVVDGSRDWNAIPVARFPVDVGDRIACMAHIQGNEVLLVANLTVVSINGISDDGEVLIGFEDDDHDMTYLAASNLVIPDYIDIDDVIESKAFVQWMQNRGVLHDRLIVKTLHPWAYDEDDDDDEEEDDMSHYDDSVPGWFAFDDVNDRREKPENIVPSEDVHAEDGMDDEAVDEPEPPKRRHRRTDNGYNWFSFGDE